MSSWWGQPGGPGVVFLSTIPPAKETVEHSGQFYLWSPLMIFSLVMAIVVGVILICLLLYSLFYFCMYGTCCCPGFGCFWCPQPAAGPPCDDDDPVKVRIRRPSRSDSIRSSVRSARSVYSHRSDCDDRKIVRINSCPSINGSVCGDQQPVIIQTIPAALPAPQVVQTLPMIQAPQVIQAPPVVQYAPPAPAPVYSGTSGPSELKIVIGESKPQNTRATSSSNVIVYDMGGRGGASSGGGITLGGGGGGRSEYVLTSVDDNFGGNSYKTSGAFNEGFERDDGSFLSDGHRSAIIDIGAAGGGFYPTLPRYDD